MMVWMRIVHKVQGLSLQKTLISFQSSKQRKFYNGQSYLTLSMAMALEGL